jgi:tryptophanase
LFCCFHHHTAITGKKEALANVGGLLCCNDDKLYEALRNLTIVVEGYPT